MPSSKGMIYLTYKFWFIEVFFMKKSYKKKIALALAFASTLSGKTSATDINKCQNSKMITSVKQGRFLNWWENRSKIQKLAILGSVGVATLATVVITTACLLKNKNNKDNEKNIPENNKENNDVISDANNNNLINKSQNSNKNQNFKKENNGENKQNNGNILDNQPKNMQKKLNQNLNEYNNVKQQEQPKNKKKINENILKIMNTKIDSCIKKQKDKANEDTYIYDSLGGRSYNELTKIVAEMIINGCLENKFEKLEFTDKQITTKIEDCKQHLDIILKYFIDVFDGEINLDDKCIKFTHKGGYKFTFTVPGDQENKLTLVIKDGSPPPSNNKENDNLFSYFYGNDKGSFLVELSSTLLKNEKKINCIRLRIGTRSMTDWH